MHPFYLSEDVTLDADEQYALAASDDFAPTVEAPAQGVMVA